MPKNSVFDCAADDLTSWMNQLVSAISCVDELDQREAESQLPGQERKFSVLDGSQYVIANQCTENSVCLTGESRLAVKDFTVVARNRASVRVRGNSSVFLHDDSYAELTGGNVFAFAADQATIQSHEARVVASGRTSLRAYGGWVGAKDDSIAHVEDGVVEVQDQAIVTAEGRTEVHARGGTVLVSDKNVLVRVQSSEARIVFLNEAAESARIVGNVIPGQIHLTNSVAVLDAINELDFRRRMRSVPCRSLRATCQIDRPRKRPEAQLTMNEREAILADSSGDLKLQAVAAGRQFERAKTGVQAVNAYLHLAVLARYNRFAKELLMTSLASQAELLAAGGSVESFSGRFGNMETTKIGWALRMAFNYDLLVLPSEIKNLQSRVRRVLGAVSQNALAQATLRSADSAHVADDGSDSVNLRRNTMVGSNSKESALLNKLENIVRGCMDVQQSAPESQQYESKDSNSAHLLEQPAEPPIAVAPKSGRFDEQEWRKSFTQVLQDLSGFFKEERKQQQVSKD